VNQSRQDKIHIYDDEEVKVAYVSDGTVYTIGDDRQIATLRGENLHAMDGQLLGHLTPVGNIHGVDGATPEAFMKLVRGE
jgi:hypothetical protein